MFRPGRHPCSPDQDLLRAGARLASTWLAAGFLAIAPLPAQPLKTASLEGHVVEAGSNVSLAGARVQLDSLGTIADGQGVFSFSGLTVGQHVLVVSAAGHRTSQVPVTLAPGANSLPAFALETDAVQLEKLVVVGQTKGARAAFDAKTSSDSLTEVVSGQALQAPTAQSASDLLKNVSGVSVTRGADGSTRIAVRGLDARFTRVTVDGQRQGGGSNALDSLPPEIVQSLEISKALTPDQDADAIGGAINVTTGTANLKDAYVQGRHQVTYNPLEPRPGTRNSITIAQPVHLFSREPAKPDAGFLLTATFDDQYRRREVIRDLREWPAIVSPGPAPYAGEPVPVLTQPRIESTREHRRRTGLVFNADVRVGAGSIYWRSNFTRDQAGRNRRLDDFDPSVGVPLALAPDYAVFSGVPQNRRDQRQVTQRDAANFALGGRIALGRLDLDGSVGAALTHESEPHTLETVFASTHTFRTTYDLRHGFLPVFSFQDETNPGDTGSIADPAGFDFNNLTVSRVDTRDRELAARFNAQLNLDGAARSNFLKFGGKFQQRHRGTNTDRQDYDPGPQARSMTGLVDTPLVTVPAGDYRFGPIPDANAVAALLATEPAVFQLNQAETLVNSTTGDYQATESIWSLYGMGRFKPGARWTVLGGVRAEGTRVDSQGNQLGFAPDGSLQGTVPARVDRRYVQVLPGLHVRFDPEPGLLFRGSVTRSLSRPGYGELTPVRQINFIDRRSRIGNPGLQPYTATNCDLSLDKYDEKAGLFSIGLFFKKIDHFIADEQYPTTIGDLGQFIEFKRVNGNSAKVWGVETSWQSVKWELPASLGTGSLNFTYTFLQSESSYPDRPGERFPMFEQSKHQANLTFQAERGKLSWDATLRYRSKDLEDVIAPGFDNYRAGSFDLEMSLAYKLGKGGRLTLGLGNLLNRPNREYSGVLSRMNQYEPSGIDVSIGLQWKVPTRAIH